MSTRSRQEYLRVLAERYRNETSKKSRSALIDEGVKNTGLHRKSVIRALHRVLKLASQSSASVYTPRPVGRPRLYHSNVSFVLKRLYKESEYQGSGKLKAMIPILLSQLKIELGEDIHKSLIRMSTASIDRYLKKYRNLQTQKLKTLTRPGSKLFKKMIPLKNLSNTVSSVGFIEADTVGHCGGNSSGEFAFSLTMTDTFSGWTANRALQNKCAIHVMPAIQHLHESFPFELNSINVDNGSEFLNHLVYGYFARFAHLRGIKHPMTRSRSYHKNDNARVEQKNWTHVRQLFGYDRIDDKQLIPIMNKIYRVQNLLQNFFIPQYKLLYKVRVGAKIKKKYDQPKTPYQRLLESSIDEHRKNQLREQYASLSYSELKKTREELLAHFFKLEKFIKSQTKGANIAKSMP